MKKLVLILLAVLTTVIFAQVGVITFDAEKATSDDPAVVEAEAQKLADTVFGSIEKMAEQRALEIMYAIEGNPYKEFVKTIKEKAVCREPEKGIFCYDINQNNEIFISYIEGRGIKTIACADATTKTLFIDHELDGLVSSENGKMADLWQDNGDFIMGYPNEHNGLPNSWVLGDDYQKQLIESIEYFHDKIE